MTLHRISTLAIAFSLSVFAFAGGYLTNTNQHASFLRMIARGASVSLDGVYSNPAGLSFLEDEKVYLSLTIQSAYQNRDIESQSLVFANSQTPDGKRSYHGKAAAPIVPSIHFAYRKGDWTIASALAITGGGGKASFDQGLPLFEASAIGLMTKESNGKLTSDMYDISSAMDGKQYIMGLTLGLGRKINEHLSVFAGGRMNYFMGGYVGHLKVNIKDGVIEALGQQIVTEAYKQLVAAGMDQAMAMQHAMTMAQQQGAAMLQKLESSAISLDCDQTGWGLTPIIGVFGRLGIVDLAAKYEFLTNLNIENSTNKLERPASAAELLKPYENGVNTPNDIPSLLTLSAGVNILPTLRATAEWHFYDDKNARMAGGKQKTLKRGTFEYLAGVEWDALDRLTISGGYQKTDYGLSDEYQSDTSFACDSYSLGFGAKVKLSEKMAMDIAYFWTTYDDYTKVSENYNGLGVKGVDVYSRTNKVFGVSLEYKF
ncbi:MAG: hypothetical protein Q4C30_01960 [Bacteroidia bacterium]|nr:hypothetical protein [Bacteroidia bacterium]